MQNYGSVAKRDVYEIMNKMMTPKYIRNEDKKEFEKVQQKIMETIKLNNSKIKSKSPPQDKRIKS